MASFDGMLFIVFVFFVWLTHCTIDVAKKNHEGHHGGLGQRRCQGRPGRGFLEAVAGFALKEVKRAAKENVGRLAALLIQAEALFRQHGPG